MLHIAFTNMILLVKQIHFPLYWLLLHLFSFSKLSFSGWLSDPLFPPQLILRGLAGELGDLLDSSLMLVKWGMVWMMKLV